MGNNTRQLELELTMTTLKPSIDRKMLDVHCSGGPYEIGFQHGRAAKTQVWCSIVFYKSLFQRVAKLSWREVHIEALKFMPMLQKGWNVYVEEMRGLAHGAEVDFESVLALNVRTEIAHGMFNDGCTALSWIEDGESFLAQNWDWNPEQKGNIISVHIDQQGKPRIHMMTEAGIIGKIGLNSTGVGVTLNAVKAKGVDFSRMPCHLALRTALESDTCAEAVLALERVGVAAPCHILIADQTNSAGLECTAFDVVRLGNRVQNGSCLERRFTCHTNHFIEPHIGPNCHPDLPDSIFRLERLNELLNQETAKPSFGVIENMLRDEANFPGSICRDQSGRDGFATLFSIVMDLNSHKAEVRMGKPTESVKGLILEP